MVINKTDDYRTGLNLIVSDATARRDMRLDFGIISLSAGEVWEDSSNFERAILLIRGKVRFEWNGEAETAVRRDSFSENPEVLQVPSGMTVRLTASSNGTELAYEASVNEKEFPPVFYRKSDIRNDVFGKGSLNDMSIRTVRTVFDGENADFSAMVMGEVVNHPGKWSSYPPHDHPHPEIYHYRLFPKQGFGVSLLDEEAHVVKHGSTSLIKPHTTHSQVAAAGYAMYYIWMIPHLPGNKWLPTTRYFRKEHEWLLSEGVTIWPDRPCEECL